MPYSVSYHEDVGVVETTYAGVLVDDEFQQAVAATIEAGADHRCGRFLSDCTTLAAGGSDSTLNIWALAEFLATLPAGTLEREAILLPEGTIPREDVLFYETACRNRGLAVRVFDSRDDALEWLTS